jgi:tyrosyl-tRNA synthetase
MRFCIHEQVFSQFPAYCIGLVVADNVPNARDAAATGTRLREAERALCARADGRSLARLPAMAVWHEAFTRAGINPSRHKTSVEALAARVLKGDALPSINPAVDLANAASLTYLVPIGAHDLDRLSGDLEVGPLREDLPFAPLGGGASETVARGEYAYADGVEVRTRRWVWRQNDHSKVTGESRAIVFPIDGWIGISDQAVRDALSYLMQALEAEFGVRARAYFLDRDQREVTIRGERAASDTVVADADGFRMAGKAYLEPTLASAADPTPPLPATAGAARASREPDAVDDLLTRGTVDVIVRDALESRLRRGERLRVKFGVDPTGPHLHLGHAVQLRKLRAFQRQGHTICLVVGDFTAQIGDASDKSAMRQMLSEEEIYANLATYRKQIARVLDPEKVEWSYNNDWLGPLRFRDVVGLAQHFTVAQMLERENYALRLQANKPIGLQEILYPLMQGYDSVALKADVEIGGTEQLFNLLAGRTLQQAFGQPPQAVITGALLLGTDGQKMSKTAPNCIYIDDKAEDMYGKVMSIADGQILPYFELATDVPLAELPGIRAELERGTNPMLLKKRLAFAITALYHGEAKAQKAQEAFERVVQRKELPDVIDEKQLDDEPRTLPDLLVALGLAKSKSEARRLAEQGGVSIDGEKVTDVATPLPLRDGMLIKMGKRSIVRLRLQL